MEQVQLFAIDYGDGRVFGYFHGNVLFIDPDLRPCHESKRPDL